MECVKCPHQLTCLGDLMSGAWVCEGCARLVIPLGKGQYDFFHCPDNVGKPRIRGAYRYLYHVNDEGQAIASNVPKGDLVDEWVVPRTRCMLCTAGVWNAHVQFYNLDDGCRYVRSGRGSGCGPRKVKP